MSKMTNKEEVKMNEQLIIEEAKKIVLKRFPKASALNLDDGCQIMGDGYTPISGNFNTENIAWFDAAQRIKRERP